MTDAKIEIATLKLEVRIPAGMLHIGDYHAMVNMSHQANPNEADLDMLKKVSSIVAAALKMEAVTVTEATLTEE